MDVFAELRALIGADLRRIVADALARIPRDLEAAGERASHVRDQQALYAAGSLLRIDETERSGNVAASFEERVRRCVALADLANPDERALALIDEDELDAQILALELAGAVRAAAGADYVAYVQRVRAICPKGWSDDDFNPLGARTIASAAVGAFRGAAESSVAKSVLHSLLPLHMTGPIIDLIARATARMIALGVVPAPTEEPVITDRRGETSAAVLPPTEGGRDLPSVPAPRTAAVDVQPAVAPDPDQSRFGQPVRSCDPVAIAAAGAAVGEALGSSALSASAEPHWRGVLPMLRPVAEIERDAVAFAHSIDASPYSREARRAYFRGVRSGLQEAGGARGQLGVVDVVAGLFDYVVDEERLSEAAKPLLWRLQQPAVALALMDVGYLGEEPRSLRRLIENLGAIATADGDQLVPGNELHRRLGTAVRAVEVVTSALQTRAMVMARQVDKEYLRAARNIEQLIERVIRERRVFDAAPGGRNRRDYSRRPSRERERQVTEHIEEVLSNRLSDRDVPEATRDFLMNVWVRHLRTAALRHGEEGAEFQLSLGVVDELLWSLGGAQERVSKSQLARKIPSLIRTLSQGTREIGARDEDYKAFFDELFLIHLRRMHRSASRSNSGVSDRVETRRGSRHSRALPPEAIEDVPSTTRDSLTSSVSHPAASKDPDADRIGSSAAGDESREESGKAQEQPDAPPATSHGRRATDAPPAGAMLFDVLPPANPEPVPPDSSERKSRWRQIAIGREESALGEASAGVSDEQGTESEDAEGNRRLLDILKSLDLGDLPGTPRHASLEPEQAFRRIRRGAWLEFSEPGTPPAYLKVAWVNRRRTVALLVRRADRRAVSIRFSELQKRFGRGRAHLLEDASD